jgi:hypothetical protein
MGGTVQLGLRTSDGKSRGVESYTSAISSFFDNDRFIEEDIFHVGEFFIDGDPDMRLIMPNCYGLVFGDQVTKKIHSVQGYTSLMDISNVSLTLSLTGSILTGESATEQDNYIDHVRFERLYNKGYIKQFAKWAKNGFEFVDLDLNTPCNQIFADLIHSYQKNERPAHGDYIIDSGYEVINYQETPAGYARFRDNLLADGIKLSNEELGMWQDSINERKEYYEEDEEEWDENPYEPDRYDNSRFVDTLI